MTEKYLLNHYRSESPCNDIVNATICLKKLGYMVTRGIFGSGSADVMFYGNGIAGLIGTQDKESCGLEMKVLSDIMKTEDERKAVDDLITKFKEFMDVEFIPIE